MKLHGETSKLLSKVHEFARKYGIPVAASAPATLDKLIVLGDGTPDDYAVFLISHYLDGSDTCGIVKPPKHTGTSTFQLVRSYLTAYGSLRGLLFILDQEERTADATSWELEQQVKKSNIRFDCCNDANERNPKVYECKFGDRQVTLILVVNGLSGTDTKKHMIEDHFLEASKRLRLVNLPKTIADPKGYWQNAVDAETQESVMRQLVEDRRLAEEVFPQQFKGCAYLKAVVR